MCLMCEMHKLFCLIFIWFFFLFCFCCWYVRWFWFVIEEKNGNQFQLVPEVYACLPLEHHLKDVHLFYYLFAFTSSSYIRYFGVCLLFVAVRCHHCSRRRCCCRFTVTHCHHCQPRSFFDTCHECHLCFLQTNL